jgi:hypothetical protein
MPVIVKLEFETEADAEAVLLELATDDRVRAADSTVTLPDGRTLGFDRYLDELMAKRDAPSR